MITCKVRVMMVPTGHGGMEQDKIFTINATSLKQYNKHMEELRQRYPWKYYRMREE